MHNGTVRHHPRAFVEGLIIPLGAETDHGGQGGAVEHPLHAAGSQSAQGRGSHGAGIVVGVEQRRR